MKTLLLIEKTEIILNFKKSFMESFQKLGINSICYEVDKEKSFEIQRKEILQSIHDNHITACLMINDITKDKEFFMTKDILHATPCYVWFVDAALRMKRKDPNLQCYKEIYTFEPQDIAYGMRVYGRKFKYLPLTAGDSIFCSHPDKEPYVYDLSFIGLVAGCPKRLEILDAVAEYCAQHGKKMICYGHFWHNSHTLQRIAGAIRFKIKHPYLYKYIINKRIEPYEAAKIYKCTRINLNIHIPQHTGFNCRTFEILGNSNFELCDIQNTDSIHFEDGKHIVFYRNTQEVLEKIKYYLQHDTEREQIAAQGGKYVREYYSFNKILGKIFQ